MLSLNYLPSLSYAFYKGAKIVLICMASAIITACAFDPVIVLHFCLVFSVNLANENEVSYHLQ